MQTSALTRSTPVVYKAQSRRVSCASSGKTDLKKAGLNKILNKTIKNNLSGRSDKMKKSDWKDASGRGRAYPFGQSLRIVRV